MKRGSLLLTLSFSILAGCVAAQTAEPLTPQERAEMDARNAERQEKARQALAEEQEKTAQQSAVVEKISQKVKLTNEPEGVRIRGEMLQWGSSQDSAKALVRPTRPLGSDFFCTDSPTQLGLRLCHVEPGADLGGGRAIETWLFFYEDKFFQYSVSFSPEDFSSVSNGIVTRLGPPVKKEASTIQNRMGASFDQEVHQWTKTYVKVVVTKRASKVTEGHLDITYLPIGEQVKSLESNAPF